MALLLDMSIPTVQDLLNCDGSLMEFAGAEGIDLQAKLDLAREEISTKVQTILFQCGEGVDALGTVVVTEPLRRWIALTAVSLSFRDGHFRHLSDRYKEKWLLYESLAESARADLMRMGLGRTLSPISRPEPGSLTLESGSLAEGSYVVAVTAVGVSGAESALSEIGSVYVEDSAGIRVEAPVLQNPSLGWNVYAGRGFEDLRKQNENPLPVNGFLLVEHLNNHGRPGSGQQPTTYTREIRTIPRG